MRIVHGGDVWQGGAPDEYLDFSANLNPEGPPDWVRAAMEQGLEQARFYPDVRQSAALAGMSAHLHLWENCLLLTGGGVEAVRCAANMPLPSGDAITHVIAQPTFQEYGRLCGKHVDIPRAGLEYWVPREGDVLWVCNPNNPTGDALPRGVMLALLKRMETVGGRLIVDEAFIDYCPEFSIRDAVTDHPSLIVLGSLTKALAVPGVRLGYLAAHPTVIFELRENLPPWLLNCLAGAVAAALPGHEADFEAIRVLNARRRASFATALAELGAKVYPSDANFLLCDFGGDMRPTVEALRGRGILVRPCDMFPGLSTGHLRLCVRTEAENGRLVDALLACGEAGQFRRATYD